MRAKLPTIKFNPKTETLVLRCCKADMTSRDRFKWPEKGTIKAPDFSKTPECGQGLHGWARGEGDFGAWSSSPDDQWLVLAVKTTSLIDLGGKVKFPSARVLFCGERDTAVALIQKHYPDAAVIYGTATAGECGTATAGYRGTATAGECGTATAGDRGTATAGECGTATAGECGTATAGYRGTATAGECGTATAGEYGTATAGYGGTATAGECGTATAGECGILQIKTWDSECSRCRIITGYIGEDGLKPNTKYKLNDKARFVEA